MTYHELKIHPRWFDAVKNGIKKCEIRKADRDFAVGVICAVECPAVRVIGFDACERYEPTEEE